MTSGKRNHFETIFMSNDLDPKISLGIFGPSKRNKEGVFRRDDCCFVSLYLDESNRRIEEKNASGFVPKGRIFGEKEGILGHQGHLFEFRRLIHQMKSQKE